MSKVEKYVERSIDCGKEIVDKDSAANAPGIGRLAHVLHPSMIKLCGVFHGKVAISIYLQSCRLEPTAQNHN